MRLHREHASPMHQRHTRSVCDQPCFRAVPNLSFESRMVAVQEDLDLHEEASAR